MDSFSAQLRGATRDAHREAAGGTFLRDLTNGRRGANHYVRMLGQLWFVYDALERAGDEFAADLGVGAFVDDTLRRVPSIETDLHFLEGAEGREGLVALPPTETYCDRIGSADSLGFLAHHYTRYLGDLSGGQMIGRAIQEQLDLGEADGWRFFRFDGIDDVDAYKAAYRDRLDTMELTPTQRERVIGNVREAYAANCGLLWGLESETTAGVP